MSCFGCGQDKISDGGLGCICNSCIRCHSISKSKDSRYCFLCGPCKKCGKTMGMHTDSEIKNCIDMVAVHKFWNKVFKNEKTST